jgi:heme exporter protein CcmD
MHFTFVAVAYGFAACALCAAIAWIAFDYRAQQKLLTRLEAQRSKKK